MNLITLAGGLARGSLLPPCEPEDWPKSTPKTVLTALNGLHKRAKTWALEIAWANDRIHALSEAIGRHQAETNAIRPGGSERDRKLWEALRGRPEVKPAIEALIAEIRRLKAEIAAHMPTQPERG